MPTPPPGLKGPSEQGGKGHWSNRFPQDRRERENPRGAVIETSRNVFRPMGCKSACELLGETSLGGGLVGWWPFPRLPTTINFIGFTESTKDFTRQKPGRSHFLNGRTEVERALLLVGGHL